MVDLFLILDAGLYSFISYVSDDCILFVFHLICQRCFHALLYIPSLVLLYCDCNCDGAC